MSSLWCKHKRVRAYAHVFLLRNWFEYENRLPRNWGEKSSSRETMYRVRPFPPDVHACSLRYRILETIDLYVFVLLKMHDDANVFVPEVSKIIYAYT